MKKLFLLLLFTNGIIAQVSVVTRNKDSYTQDVFPYKGVRAIQIDEVHCSNNEENIFIFSKIEKNANPDRMYFQRFTKKDDKWSLVTLSEIDHNGIISAWGSRKGFMDYNKDKSIDAFFIYGLYDSDFKQQSVCLLFSQYDKVYTIKTDKKSEFKNNIFSENFKELDGKVRKQIMEYWDELDKIDN